MNAVPGTGLNRYGVDLAKPERGVELPRRAHLRKRVDPHAVVAEAAGVGDHGESELPAEAAAAEGGPYVEPLHLAAAFLERAQRDAARDVACDERDEDAARRAARTRSPARRAPCRSPGSRGRSRVSRRTPRSARGPCASSAGFGRPNLDVHRRSSRPRPRLPGGTRDSASRERRAGRGRRRSPARSAPSGRRGRARARH